MQFRPNYRKLALLAALSLAIVFREALVTSLLPFVLAFILAAMIDPAVSVLESRLKLPRGPAVLLTLVTLIAVAGYMMSLVLAKVAAELVDLGSKLPSYQRELLTIADTLIARLNELYEYLPPQVSTYLQNTINDLSRNAIVVLGDTIDRTLRAISGLPAVMIVIIVTVIATYFLSRDREQLTDALYRLAPRQWQKPLRDAQDKIILDLIGFLKAQLLIFIVTTGIATAGLYYIGTRFWMVIGITLGILDVIPVVGPGLVLFPWAGISLAMGELQRALELCLLFVAILAVRQVAQAKLLGDSVGVHPLAMLVAVYAGVVIFGVKGVLVGPLLVIVGRALWASGLILQLNPDGKRAGDERRLGAD